MNNSHHPIINARHSFEKARYELEVAKINLEGTGRFQSTVREINDVVYDLSKCIDAMNLHLKD